MVWVDFMSMKLVSSGTGCDVRERDGEGEDVEQV